MDALTALGEFGIPIDSPDAAHTARGGGGPPAGRCWPGRWGARAGVYPSEGVFTAVIKLGA